MTSKSFFVFDREYPANNLLPLLGRVVAKPRRPLDGYVPRHDTNNDRLAYLSTFTLDLVTEKPGKVHAESIKSAGGRLGLQKIFGISADSDVDATYELSSSEIKTLALEQHLDVFNLTNKEHNSDLEALLTNNNGPLYMMVAIKTAVKPKLIRRGKATTLARAKLTLPVIEATTGTPNPQDIGNPQISAHVKTSRSSALESTGKGELAFAAEYVEIVRKSDLIFDMKKGITVNKKLKSKGIKRASGRGLAFGNEESEDEDEDESSNEKRAEEAEVIYV